MLGIGARPVPSSIVAGFAATMTQITFPAEFLWGVAGSGHQTEGGNVDSYTWYAEHVSPSVFREPSGIACDSWNRWKEDLDLVTAMGLSAYRFSVEWARVEPVAGEWNHKALDHYAAIADECLARRLAPVVTFSHFTAPRWFAERGSWLNCEAADRFARFCGRVMDAFGDRIAVAITLNEPNLPQVLSWLHLPDVVRDLERATLDVASRSTGSQCFRLGNVVLPEDLDAMADGLEAGHRAAKAAIKTRRPDLPVGFSMAIVDDVVVGDDSRVRDRKRAECYERWLRLARNDDFLGVQNYEQVPYDADGEVSPPAGVATNQMGTAIVPESLAGAVRYAYQETGVPILVTEHGMATDDDTDRAAFLAPALDSLDAAIADGIPVLGYCHWTLLDNFEWVFGYAYHLGLHEVDRTTMARTRKPSAGVYAELVRARS